MNRERLLGRCFVPTAIVEIRRGRGAGMYLLEILELYAAWA